MAKVVITVSSRIDTMRTRFHKMMIQSKMKAGTKDSMAEEQDN
jgi:hypothetical protein